VLNRWTAYAAFAAALVGVHGSAAAAVLEVGDAAPTVQQTIDKAADGDTVIVPAGVWKERITIKRRIVLRGLPGNVIDGGKQGTTMVLESAGAIIDGIEVRASGHNLTTLDACLYVAKSATGSIIRNSKFRRCAFGIWINETTGVRIENNAVWGLPELRTADRGNGIHLFNASKLIVRGNTVIDARDGLYVSATEHSLIENNHTNNLRYGIHYMYSYDNVLRGNHSHHNTAGMALMESKRLKVVANVTRDNARYGIMFRDAEDCLIKGNIVERNGQGLFFFSSVDNTIKRNRIAGNLIGAKVWAGSFRNTISENAFIGNKQQVFFVGAKDLVIGVKNAGNYWSDYVGWDQDGDGLGDRPYRMGSFVSSLTYKYPAAAVLMYSPTMELLNHMAERMPMLRTTTIVDRSPQMRIRHE